MRASPSSGHSIDAHGHPTPTNKLGYTEMSTSERPAQKSRFFSPRRLLLLAGIASLGGAVLFTSPGFLPQSQLPSINGAAFAQTPQTPQAAQNAQRPVGFADIVETVKPAVISVRVKIDGGSRLSFDAQPTPRGTPGTPGTPMDRFFRSLPDGVNPELRR